MFINYNYPENGTCCPFCRAVGSLKVTYHFKTSGHVQNGSYFADDIFQFIFLKKIAVFFFLISLRFVPKGLIESALVKAWCQTRNKPLPEPMLTKFYDAIWHHKTTMIKLIHIKIRACFLSIISAQMRMVSAIGNIFSHWLRPIDNDLRQ